MEQINLIVLLILLTVPTVSLFTLRTLFIKPRVVHLLGELRGWKCPAFLRNSNGRFDLPGPTQEAA